MIKEEIKRIIICDYCEKEIKRTACLEEFNTKLVAKTTIDYYYARSVDKSEICFECNKKLVEFINSLSVKVRGATNE